MSHVGILPIFEPCQYLRSGVKYRFLKHHDFSSIDQEWIAQFILYHGSKNKSAKNSRLKEICHRYQLYMNVVDEWVQSYENDNVILDVKGARGILSKFKYREGDNTEDGNIIDSENFDLILQELNASKLRRIRRPDWVRKNVKSIRN